ncbi:uncharacterized protein LOC116288650 [Actinia tenebrosa]|uniref:Uncharacterized protein LOC116288650 n=1 Tax=Actinia tenebrosa TaxID=6105 RepID=A0A6P8H7W3_ACTTE|nr:uncharacterized protein LOC116288650 [Actinia tenebrosa]
MAEKSMTVIMVLTETRLIKGDILKRCRNQSTLLQDTGDHFSFKKRRFLVQNTKKFGCPAQVIMREVMQFPGYKVVLILVMMNNIDKNTERGKRSVSEKLRKDIEKGCAKGETRIYIEFPKMTDHQGHPTGEASGILQQIDPRLINKIQKLATSEGKTSVNEMKRHLNTFVRHELCQEDDTPSILNRRFFPSKTTIKNHMYRAFIKEQLSNIDQKNLEEKIEIWQKESANDKFKFRPYVEEEEKDPTTACDGLEDDVADNVKIDLGKRGLLFVHQTKWQQELMLRYGNELTLLDATYKTTKYALPLYFVVVKTNIDYQVVGSFVIQSETSEAIKEALGILRDWSNNKWSPLYFMVDCAEEEITAIQEIFNNCQVYICDFHREQAWERWLSKGTNGLTEKKDLLLAKLRAIARSRTEQECNVAVDNLKSTPEWKTSKNLKNWIENTWLRQKKRWVWAYRKERLLVNINTNNGVERQNKTFKYDYLVGKLKPTLSRMITVLVEDFLPDKFNRYVEGNCRLSSSFKEYNRAIPEYLHNRPTYVVKHCQDRMTSAQDFTMADIQVLEQQNNTCFFKVKSHPHVYEVQFGNSESLPSCQCLDWEKTRLPYKHFFAIFKCIPKWNFSDLPEHYRHSPFLTLDENVMFGTSTTHTYKPRLDEDSVSSHDINSASPSEQPAELQQQSKPLHYKDIPQRKKFFKTAATKCFFSQVKQPDTGDYRKYWH